MRKHSYLEYLNKKIIEDLKIPHDDYRFSTVETILDKINENRVHETWEEAAKRIHNRYPKISRYLTDAYERFCNERKQSYG